MWLEISRTYNGAFFAAWQREQWGRRHREDARRRLSMEGVLDPPWVWLGARWPFTFLRSCAEVTTLASAAAQSPNLPKDAGEPSGVGVASVIWCLQVSGRRVPRIVRKGHGDSSPPLHVMQDRSGTSESERVALHGESSAATAMSVVANANGAFLSCCCECQDRSRSSVCTV